MLKTWFIKLKEITQLTLVIVGMAFIIALIDEEVRVAFMVAIEKITEGIWQNGQWLQ